MAEQGNGNWQAWLEGIGAASTLVIAFLRGFFVTRAELKEVLMHGNKRHEENVTRFCKQEKDLNEIKVVLGRMDERLENWRERRKSEQQRD